MPRIPKWFGNAMETVFSGMIHPVTVTKTEFLDEKLLKVCFQGDFSKINFIPGNVIEFRVSDNEFRHYTPSVFDVEHGVCEILFYLHDGGIGSNWVTQLSANDCIKLIGPGGKINYNEKLKHHFFFGDETSLSLFYCMKNAVLKNNQTYLCVLEMDEEHEDWPGQLGILADIVPKSHNDPAKAAIIKIEDLQHDIRSHDPFWEDIVFYLTGRAKSIQAVRKVILSWGISTKRIQTEPYWAEGKKGL